MNMTFLNTTKKFGAVIAVAFALGAPVVAASSASAEPMRYEDQRGDSGYHSHFDRNRENSYRDMKWRHARFEHSCRHEQGRFEHGRFEHGRFER
jgi:hypothetical protein